MGKYKNYTGIDFFRLIAAILIITIHTVSYTHLTLPTILLV